MIDNTMLSDSILSKKVFNLDCFIAYAPRNDTSAFYVIVKQSQRLKFLYIKLE